jgi:hypothetical protein
VKADWDASNVRSLADEPIVRLILEGTVVEVRLDGQATAISLPLGRHRRARGRPEGAAAMLFWALLASGQISMRKVDGWRTLARTSIGQPIDLAA